MLRHVPAVLLILGPVPMAEADPALAAQRTGQCSMNSLPEPEKRRLIEGYKLRLKTQGRASADAWAKSQEESTYQRLVAQGSCPATRATAPRQTARAPAPARTAGKKVILNKQGKPCRNITVENQVFPGFGGEPMRMALVQVCKD
ncbi:hypothetical protein HNP52_003125 [Sphingomonas kyeonggiensis]|uniref:Uncharacterized protein n=1 Tax=Sphingomonas kyeonggiensis TaxID=1268553 RepID=A0A7W7NSJ7_9SPHN|nr:hypothetical protein [Sphingomonas kyeonggiensis]MBB4840033.1 hypothetical protein [Sphingomonas kyeonggiensis]